MPDYLNFKKKLINIFELSKNDFRSVYAGNFLGVLWAFVYPFITVLLYWFVFQVALKSNIGSGVPYILWLFSALIPYLFFCDAIAGVSNVFVDYSYLVKKVMFDTETLPIMRIVAKLFIHIFFVVLLILLSCIFGYSPKVSDLWILYYITVEVFFVYALGKLLSVLNIFFRDIGGIITVFIQIGYWLTPIFWNIDDVDIRIQVVVKILNPITYVSCGMRDVILYGCSPIESPNYSIYFLLISILIFVLSKAIFKKLKPVLADYV